MDEKKVKLISTEEIVPNRFQPRKIFNEKELNELANSIKEHGIIQPLILRPLGDRYEIIAGERRYKAALIAGLYNVPAIVLEKDDNESAEIAIIENIQRTDLTPIEEAKSYQKLLNKGLTQEDVAKKLGIAQSTVANKLRLLGLPEEVQEALLNKKISERHARALLKLENASDQLILLNRIINEKINVKQTEEEINSILGISNEEEKTESSKDEIEFFDIPLKESSNDTIPGNSKEVSIEPLIELKDLNKKPDSTDVDDIFYIDNIESKSPTIEKPDSYKSDVLESDSKPDKKESGEVGYLETVYKTRDFVDSLSSNGKKIKKEEYDLGNEYHIVIRIEK